MQSAVITRSRVFQFLVPIAWVASTFFFLTILIDWAVTLNSENRDLIVALVLCAPIILAGVMIVVLSLKEYYLTTIFIGICTLVYIIEMLLTVATKFPH